MQQGPLFPPENPYAAPGTAPYYGQGGEPPPGGAGMPAGFWVRVGARIVDLIAGLCLGAVIGIALLKSGLHPHRVVARSPMEAFATAFSPAKLGIALLGPVVYHSIAEWMTGASVGKLAFGLRVRHENGGPATLGGTFLRSVLYNIDSFCCGLVGYLVMKDSPQQQRIGDKVGKTVVVLKPPGEPALNVTGIFLGLAGWAALTILNRFLG